MAYGKHDVLQLLESIPDDEFDARKFLHDLAFRVTIEDRIRDAEQGIDVVSDEEVRKHFKWL